MNEKTNLNLKNPVELSAEQESILEKNLVWIFASPRSGTSWLANQLLTYQTYQMDEPHIGFHLQSLGVLEDSQEIIESHKKRSSYFFCDEFKQTWNFYLRKLILNRIYVQFPDISKKIILKEPNGSFGADNLTDLLPSCKIILLLRDGRDVVDSLVDARSKKGWGAKESAGEFKNITSTNRMSFIKRQSFSWKVRTQLLLRTYDKHVNNFRFKVKYEDLKKNTFQELIKIYDYIQVHISEEKIKEIVEKFSFEKIPEEEKGSGKITRFATPGKWKENFSEEEIKMMNDIMGETLKKLGYD